MEPIEHSMDSTVIPKTLFHFQFVEVELKETNTQKIKVKMDGCDYKVKIKTIKYPYKVKRLTRAVK